ncbi:terminase small subunit [Marinicella sp. S1101]|uniref:terminase small subunit n=1 Tax=Marinicella marina TaxID=2996016 RepID=UPI0022608A40|nr:terminase small subunit [Marinicella marina]MCX7553640.1 terminase small subunit [Marinicella marina]MDJ1140264.1 terminase small subunit [Marinicella marina]
MARKTKYNEQTTQQLIDYMGEYETHGDVIPTVEGFSDVVGVCKKTVYNWSQKPENKEFLHALERLKTKQHRTLLNRGLSCQINPMLTKLMLINNHGYTEKKEVKKDNEITVVELRTNFDDTDYDSMTDEQLRESIRNIKARLEE